MEQAFSFGHWLQQRRRALNLTQEALGQCVGCAGETIRKIEADARRPSTEIAERLARCLHIPDEEHAGFLRFARGESSGQVPGSRPESTAPSPWHQPAAPVVNIPVPPTRLIGREHEVTALGDLLQRPDVHLVTLTGPGGVGKTRLALEVAAELQNAFADGVFFVALAPISDPALVLPTITQPLGIKESGEQSLLDSLKAYLRSKHLLLLLDNFEQVVPVASLVADLVTTAPKLKVLVTSRVPLQVSSEQEFPVSPLVLPNQHQVPLALDALLQTPAVALFIQRARAVKPDLVLTDQQALVVAEICTRLDGLPLAIELAAARIKLLSPQALLPRLDKRLSLLTAGKVDQDPRHRTLRAAIDWSYQLLAAGEQQLFARLAVFVSGWTLEAAEAIGQGGGEVPLDVLTGLASLLDKSLIQQGEGMNDEGRFTMLETIREYALERLEASEEAAAVRRQHATFYLALAEQAEHALGHWRSATMTGSEAPLWFARLAAEHDNLRAALHWALHQRETTMALRLAGALGSFWQVHGHATEGRRWLEQALADMSSVPVVVRAKALRWAGALALLQGDLEHAQRRSQESLKLWRRVYDRAAIAVVLFDLGMVTLNQLHYEQADSYFQESLALWRELQDRQGIAAALQHLGLRAFSNTEYATAQAHIEESLALFKALGDTPGIAWNWIILGWIVLYRGDADQARMLCEQSLTLQRQLNNLHGIAVALQYLAYTVYEQGDPAQATTLLAESLLLHQQQGNKWFSTACLEALARIAAGQHPARAARLLGAADALRGALHTPIIPAERQHYYDRLVTTLRTALGEEAFQAAWAEGSAMAWEQAIAYAFAGSQPEPATAPPESASQRTAKYPDGLTKREVEVLRLLAQGLTNAQIAEHLVISPRTVDAHLTSIYGKIGVACRSAATRYALGHHLV